MKGRSVFGKWCPEILYTLDMAPVGFEALRRGLPGLSPRVLSLKLRLLAEMDLVEREVVDGRPPRVLYSLTDRGRVTLELVDPVLRYLGQTGSERQRSRAKNASTLASAP